MSEHLAPTLPLSGGTAIPVVGLGTWPMKGDEAAAAVRQAIELGYRHVDTAEAYDNEEAVGRGIRESGIAREDIWVTTKFQKHWHGVDLVRGGLLGNLERLGLDYVDLLLVHWPNPDQDRYVEAWQGLLKVREEGLARAIGVSNFLPEHLQRLLDETGVAPEVNQIETHPYDQRVIERKVNRDNGIVTEAWSPLGRDRGVTDDPVIVELARELDRSPGQVVLRWQVQEGNVVIPKSSHRDRQLENLALFDFELSPEQMSRIAGLERGPDENTQDPRSFGH